MKTNTLYKPGDIIKTIGIYVNSDGEATEEEYALVLDVFKSEKEWGTTIYYNVLKRPAVWNDIYELEEGTFTRILSEDFLYKNSKKLGHISIAKWRKAK